MLPKQGQLLLQEGLELGEQAFDDSSYSDLTNAVWCPICGGELAVESRGGKNVLVCIRHGEMKFYLTANSERSAEEEVN